MARLSPPFGLPWTRTLTIGVSCAAVLVLAMVSLAALTDVFFFPYVSEGFSDFGAALPERTTVAYELRWKGIGVFIALCILVFGIPRVRMRDAALIALDVIGVHAIAIYALAFQLPLLTLWTLPP